MILFVIVFPMNSFEMGSCFDTMSCEPPVMMINVFEVYKDILFTIYKIRGNLSDLSEDKLVDDRQNRAVT